VALIGFEASLEVGSLPRGHSEGFVIDLQLPGEIGIVRASLGSQTVLGFEGNACRQRGRHRTQTEYARSKSRSGILGRDAGVGTE
jgi:hypothetical protein